MESYIQKVCAQVHPSATVSKPANEYIQSLLMGVMPKFDVEGKKLYNQKKLMALTNAVIPGELGKHGVSEGVKAVTKFTNDAKNNLVFEPEWAQENLSNPMDMKSLIFIASVFEYLTAEILELGGNAARDRESTYDCTIEVDDVQKAIKADDELNQLFPTNDMETD